MNHAHRDANQPHKVFALVARHPTTTFHPMPNEKQKPHPIAKISNKPSEFTDRSTLFFSDNTGNESKMLFPVSSKYFSSLRLSAANRFIVSSVSLIFNSFRASSLISFLLAAFSPEKLHKNISMILLLRRSFRDTEFYERFRDIFYNVHEITRQL